MDIVKQFDEFEEIPKNGLVIVETGWGSAFWTNKAKYAGQMANGSLAFPKKFQKFVLVSQISNAAI